MLKHTLLCCLIALPFALVAQDNYPDDFLPMDFHRNRRDVLRNKMPVNSVAVIFSGPIRNRANDVSYMYHQDPNFYYLTGHREPHSVLVIFKEEQRYKGQTFNEFIFVHPRGNALEEVYDGVRLGKEGAKKRLEMEVVFETPQFKDVTIDFSKFDKVLFYDFKNDVRNTEEEGDLYDLITAFKEKINYSDGDEVTVEPSLSNLDTRALDSLLTSMRGIKTEEELKLLRRAIDISAIGQIEVMKAMRPDISEFEVQGMHEFIFKKYGAEYEGYTSIVGSGHNGTVLHYIENSKPKIKEGELILMDVGAEYHGYTADLTRTLPVNGEFSKEQKLIYDLVCEAQKAAMEICKAGVPFSEIYWATANVINKGLVELGLYKSLAEEDIINSATGRNRYYPHGCCHHIGLDVHDLGVYDTLRANMVFTIEPGIYIPKGSPVEEKWWNIPVRVEDNFLVKEEGCELLSSLVPRRSEEIEKIMKETSAFEKFDLPDLGGK